jgi:hypothetical protein
MHAYAPICYIDLQHIQCAQNCPHLLLNSACTHSVDHPVDKIFIHVIVHKICTRLWIKFLHTDCATVSPHYFLE